MRPARARTRARTRYGQGKYLWISFKILWILIFFFKWKLVFFPFCSYVLHMILLYFNIRREPVKVLWKFVYKSKLFNLLSKSLYFLEIFFFCYILKEYIFSCKLSISMLKSDHSLKYYCNSVLVLCWLCHKISSNVVLFCAQKVEY